MAMDGTALRARFEQELARLLPRAREARVERFALSREHAATYRAAPGAQALRPGARTRLPRLVLAGAWTASGWPATMEGAVRSGQLAARALVEQLAARGAPRAGALAAEEVAAA
jgi:uncharacterized protein with NAD-binding domain and iron-sulfur cluster